MDSSDIMQPGQPVAEIPPALVVVANELNIKRAPSPAGLVPVLEIRNTFAAATLGLTADGIRGIIGALTAELEAMEGTGLVTPPPARLHGPNGLPL